MMIHVGTSGYGYKEWKGKFYPDKIPPREMLRFYAGRLNAVEINNTFYRMPNEAVLATWAEQVPDDFVFAVKAPQVITHLKQLRNAGAEVEYFFRALSALDKKQGPVLFQFPASFHADRDRLQALLDLIPGNRPCAFEFRGPSGLDAKITELLVARGHTLCIADTDEAGVKEIARTPSSWGYLRLRRSDYTPAALSGWSERILRQKWERVFVFFKHEEEARGPELAMGFVELIHPGARRRRIA